MRVVTSISFFFALPLELLFREFRKRLRGCRFGSGGWTQLGLVLFARFRVFPVAGLESSDGAFSEHEQLHRRIFSIKYRSWDTMSQRAAVGAERLLQLLAAFQVQVVRVGSCENEHVLFLHDHPGQLDQESARPG